MDDWRDFAKQHAKEIEMWRDFWSPDYVPLTLHGIEARIEEAKKKAKDGESSSSAGSESLKGEMPKFNPMVEFFKVLAKSYLGVRVDKFKTLQDFQRKTGESLCKVYARMKRLIVATGGVTEAQSVLFWYAMLSPDVRRRVRDAILLHHYIH